MICLLKHPQHGCRHVAPEEVDALVAAGWTRFPRSRAEKAAGSWPPARQPVHVRQPAQQQDADDGDASLSNEPSCTESQTPSLAMPEIPIFTAQRQPAAQQARPRPRRA